jgi:hypothetical protein
MKQRVRFRGLFFLAVASLVVLAACDKETPPPIVVAEATLASVAKPVDELLIEAVENQDAPAVERHLKAGGNPMAMTSMGPLPVLAGAMGNADIIGQLGKYGANFNALDVNGLAPIHLAASAGNPAAVAQLLDLGVDVNSLGGTSAVGTPLAGAVAGGHFETVDLLLQGGADINLAGPAGVTPLMSAVDIGDVDMANLLITNGAVLDLQDPNGFTPLHFAALNDDLAMVQLLLDNGADFSILNEAGQLPFEMGEVLPGLDAGELNGLFPGLDSSGLDDILPDLGAP